MPSKMICFLVSVVLEGHSVHDQMLVCSKNRAVVLKIKTGCFSSAVFLEMYKEVNWPNLKGNANIVLCVELS